MANYISPIILLLIISCTSPIHGSCMRSRLVSQVTQYGSNNQYCEYNGLKVLPGAMFKVAAPNCLDCRCTYQGLRCCGFGFAAGVVAPPPGCKVHNDACNVIFVKEDDPSELCEPSKPNKNNIKTSFNRRS